MIELKRKKTIDEKRIERALARKKGLKRKSKQPRKRKKKLRARIRDWICALPERLKELCVDLLTADWRHYLSVVLVAGSALLFFLHYDLTLERLVSAGHDFVSSFFLYINTVLKREHVGEISVNIMPEIDLQRICPFSIADVLRKLELLGPSLLQKQMWQGYCRASALVLYNILFYITMFGPLVVVLAFLSFKLAKRHTTSRRTTKPLSFYLKYIVPLYRKVAQTVRSFFQFFDDHSYSVVFVLIWLFNLNIATMIVEFFAWYLSFAASLSLSALGVNVARLLIDVLITFWSLPFAVWLVFGVWVFDDIRKSIGLNKLRFQERCNAAFFSMLAVVVLIIGTMGKGKTTMVTDLCLTGMNYYRRKAREIMLKYELMFPAFPWQRLEDAVTAAADEGVINSWHTCKAFVRRKIEQYKADPCPHTLFGYNVNVGESVHDGLTDKHLYSALESYAKAFYLYSIDTSLISANYSIADETVRITRGNSVRWIDDFFSDDPRKKRYCHVLDFDTKRTRTLVENNPLHGSKEFGIDAITELGKERGNMMENKHLKKDSAEVNQLNDGYNIRTKMQRHRALLDNVTFCKDISDEQRKSSLGANDSDNYDIIRICDRSEPKIAMPFFSLGELIYDLFHDKFCAYYDDLRYHRGDQTLFKYLLTSIYGIFWQHYTRIVNRFGYEVLTVSVQNGAAEEDARTFKYYLAYRKIYSDKFKSDCHSSVFEKETSECKYGLIDIPTYGSLTPTDEEYEFQRSYYMRDLTDSFGSRKED